MANGFLMSVKGNFWISKHNIYLPTKHNIITIEWETGWSLKRDRYKKPINF